ncbi:MAG: LysR family transcriptional regulator [Sedimenticola sp.]
MSKKYPTLIGQISDIDIRLLRIYRTVVESGGFSAAEVDLNISRPAISIAMADLEKRVGLRLCHRGRSGFSLTDEGTQIYEAVLQLFASLESFRTEVNAIHAQLKGDLNIGITDNLVTMHHMRITNALKTLKERGPGVQIHISMMPPNETERGVLDGRLHVGVVPELRPLSGLEYYPLYREESRLYCSDQHPLSTSNGGEPDDESIIQQDAVIPAYAQTPEVKAQHQHLTATATATDREGVAFLILTGRFIGYLPTHYAEQWVTAGRMQALLPETLRYVTHYTAITRKGARSHIVLETFMDELKKQPVGV